MADDFGVQLRFDGVRYGYWQQVDIRESVDDLCAAVNLSITGPGNGDDLGLTPNTVIDVLADGELVTTVRRDIYRRKVTEKNHTIRLGARSLGRELVDCQYSVTLSGLHLGEVVKRLCDTFGVPVEINAETAVVEHFSMQCEQPSNALINAVRAANLLLYPQPDGGLILTAPTSAPPVATLVYGEHIKSYEVVDEDKLRFSEYRVKSYDYDHDKPIKGAVKDEGISYFRPLHIVADRHGHGLGGCDRRAQLERNRRLARAHRIELEVQGWGHEAGLWAINTQVRVVIPQENIDGVYMIGERGLSLDAQGGQVTHLQIMDRAAFLGEEKKKQKRSAGRKR